MVAQQRTKDESNGSSSEDRAGGPGIGTLMFMTACGIGLGLLTAPETGRQARKHLRKGLSMIGGEVLDRWGEMHDRFDEVREASARAGRGARKGAQKGFARLRNEAEDRWHATQHRLAALEDQLEHMHEDEDEDTGSSFLTVALGIAAGAGLAYFLMADDAASARSKVQEVASDLRQQATNRWQQFRRGGTQAPAAAAPTFTDEV